MLKWCRTEECIISCNTLGNREAMHWVLFIFRKCSSYLRWSMVRQSSSEGWSTSGQCSCKVARMMRLDVCRLWPYHSVVSKGHVRDFIIYNFVECRSSALHPYGSGAAGTRAIPRHGTTARWPWLVKTYLSHIRLVRPISHCVQKINLLMPKSS